MTVNRLAPEIGDWPLFEPPASVLSIACDGPQLGVWAQLPNARELGDIVCDRVARSDRHLGFIGCVSDLTLCNEKTKVFLPSLLLRGENFCLF